MDLSIVIPTRNRAERLQRTLQSICRQAVPPREVIVVDGGDEVGTVARLVGELRITETDIRVVRASRLGAAAQRNQGVSSARGELIGFCDDDIDLEPQCLEKLQTYLIERPEFGGVSATITNQAPRKFGRITRAVVGMIDSRRGLPLDGRVIGPAINFLPRIQEGGPAIVETQWLTTTCTLYRRTALPEPPFDGVFEGYSFMEDVCLSLRVGARARLAVLHGARIFHDSQPGDHKRRGPALGAMCVRNRYYVATRVLRRPAGLAWLQLTYWQAFCAIAGLRQIEPGWMRVQWGAFAALAAIAFGSK